MVEVQLTVEVGMSLMEWERSQNVVPSAADNYILADWYKNSCVV